MFHTIYINRHTGTRVVALGLVERTFALVCLLLVIATLAVNLEVIFFFFSEYLKCYKNIFNPSLDISIICDRCFYKTLAVLLALLLPTFGIFNKKSTMRVLLSYVINPFHNLNEFEDVYRRLESICIGGLYFTCGLSLLAIPLYFHCI